MEDFAYFFVPMGYAPWGVGNPVYLAVPAAFLVLCLGVYIFRRMREARVPKDMPPSSVPPSVDAALAGALAERSSRATGNARGSARVMMATVIELIGSGDMRVEPIPEAPEAGDSPEDSPFVDDSVVASLRRRKAKAPMPESQAVGGVTFELLHPAELSWFRREALGMLFPKGRSSIPTDEWLRWFHGKGRHYDKGKRLMRSAERALAEGGLAKPRPFARVLLSGPVFAAAMLWSLAMVPAFAGVAGGVICMFAVGIGVGTLGNTKPLLTQTGADTLARARANLAWARGVARDGRLPEGTPRGRELARLLAAVTALGGAACAVAVAELVAQEGGDDEIERELALLLSRRYRDEAAGDSIDVRTSPAGLMIDLLERQQDAIEDR